MTERKSGYYWVCHEGDWVIANWNTASWWWLDGDNYLDEDFDKIGPCVPTLEEIERLQQTDGLAETMLAIGTRASGPDIRTAKDVIRKLANPKPPSKDEALQTLEEAFSGLQKGKWYKILKAFIDSASARSTNGTSRTDMAEIERLRVYETCTGDSDCNCYAHRCEEIERLRAAITAISPAKLLAELSGMIREAADAAGGGE